MFSQTITRLRRVPWERWSQIALLVLLAFAILWRGGRTLEVTLLLSGVASWVVFARRRGDERPLPVWLTWGVLLFILLTIFSYVATTTMNYGFDEVAQTVALGLLFLWMVRQPEGTKLRLSLLRVLVVTVLVSCLIGVLVYALGPLSRFVGTFLDLRDPWERAWPNAWAELLLLTWPVALLLAHPQREHGKGVAETFWKIARRSIPVGVILGCLLLSFSRAAMLVFAGQVVVLLIWAAGRGAPWKRVAALGVSALAIGLILFGLSNHLRARDYPVQSLSEKALFLSDEGTSSIAERLSFWRQAVRLASERPILGFGPGSFRFTQTPLMEGVLETSDHPHSVFLKVASERGWPATLVLLSIFLIVLFPLIRGLLPELPCGAGGCPFVRGWSMIPRRELTTERALLFTAVLGVLAHNLVDFNLQFVGVSFPFVLILAMLTGEGREERGEKAERAGRSNKNFVRIVELILALGLLLASVHEGICATTALLGRRAEHLGQTERALRWYRWSSGEWFARDLPLALTRLTLRAGAPDQALQKVTRYTEEENPYDARGWRIQGEVLSASGRTVEAIEALSRAYELGRFTDLSITRELIQELGEQGGVETLLPRKQEFDALLRQYYDAILRNSHYVALSPNVEEFLRVSELLSELFPADEPRYQVMAAGVDRQAKMERLRLSALRQQL